MPRPPRPAAPPPGVPAPRAPSAALAALARCVPCLLLAGVGCGPGGAPRFVERAAAAGLDVPLTCGSTAKVSILEVNGNGAALADLDGDGDLDVVLVDGSTAERWLAGEPVAHHVLRNGGVRDGVPRFELQPDAGLVMSGWPTGIAAGDVDRDGRVDLLVGGLGEDALFLNRTAGADSPLRFEKRALPGRASPADWTTSVALADADGDGRLDAYLARYLTIDPAHPPVDAIVEEGTGRAVPCRFHDLPVMCGPEGLPPQPDVLLRGTGDGTTFEDASRPSGIADLPPRYGLGVLFADLDLDGDPDLYVANDSVDNFVLANRGDGVFADVSARSGAASDMSGRAQAGMGVDVGDLDGDGRLDLVVTNFSDEHNAVYPALGPLQYRDATAATGLLAASRPMLGWGVQLGDYDADGRLDLFVSNGHVFPQADAAGTGTRYTQPCQLFPGRPPIAVGRPAFGPDRFDDPTPIRGRAALRGDLDGDGDLDLLVLTLDGVPRLYLNRTDDPRRQMLVSLRDRGADAFGATLTVWPRAGADGPATPLLRQVLSAGGFQSSPDPRLHLALPASAAGACERAEVLWPGGEREVLDAAALRPGSHHVVERGRGVVASSPLRRVP